MKLIKRREATTVADLIAELMTEEKGRRIAYAYVTYKPKRRKK